MERFGLLSKEIGKNQEVAVFYPPLHPSKLNSNTDVIVMLHGNWATYRRFENYGRFFSDQGFLVVAPTFRHHYKFNFMNLELGKTSIRDYAHDVDFLLASLYLGNLGLGFTPTRPPIVIGHSMGGLVAQLLASQGRYLTSLKALILLCSAPPAGVSLRTDKDYKKRIRKFAPKILKGLPYLPDFESLALYAYNNMPKETHKDLYASAVHESGTSSREILAGSGSGLARLIARIKSRPIKVDEKKIYCPMLIIGCEKDRIIPDATASDLFKKYAGRNNDTRLSSFEEFAHWPQYEPGWEKSAEFILNWLKFLN